MHKTSFHISGNLLDIVKREIYPATVWVENGKIHFIKRDTQQYVNYILPGFIDAHIHIESSMLIPSEFAREAVRHGTISTISDPHEIANVLGMKGIDFMIANGKKVPFYFYFGAPSCVPATSFESSGSIITPEDIEKLLDQPEIVYLAEMMNFPGVLNHDPDVMAKIQSALKKNKVIDGHAPGLAGVDAEKYFGAGISTDHECFTLEEATKKANLGVKILIREGSAAKNFDALLPLLNTHPAQIMFCSDDKHPDELVKGHINKLAARAITLGYNIFDVLAACTYNPVKHYQLRTGLLQQGDNADFIIVDSLQNMNVLQSFIKGEKVFDEGKVLFPTVEKKPINFFLAKTISVDDIKVKGTDGAYRVIKAIENEIVTEEISVELTSKEGLLQTNPVRDVLKIVVVNRYHPAPPAVGFIHGFGFENGAIASTVAHDSHNLIAVGVDDKSICDAINHLIAIQGGICVSHNKNIISLPLPVAGLMSLNSAQAVATKYKELDATAKSLGSKLSAPFMTLSFMSLLVIPKLKLSDKGLFDGTIFDFVPLSKR